MLRKRLSLFIQNARVPRASKLDADSLGGARRADHGDVSCSVSTFFSFPTVIALQNSGSALSVSLSLRDRETHIQRKKEKTTGDVTKLTFWAFTETYIQLRPPSVLSSPVSHLCLVQSTKGNLGTISHDSSLLVTMGKGL